MKMSIGKFTGSKWGEKKEEKPAFCRSLWKTVLHLILALCLARPGACVIDDTPGLYHFREAQESTQCPAAL